MRFWLIICKAIAIFLKEKAKITLYAVIQPFGFPDISFISLF